MPRIMTHGGTSWLAIDISTKHPEVEAVGTEMIGIACVQCTLSRDWFISIRVARKQGWRRIVKWKWLSVSSAACGYKGICPSCCLRAAEGTILPL